jgi:hypothetical protein
MELICLIIAGYVIVINVIAESVGTRDVASA